MPRARFRLIPELLAAISREERRLLFDSVLLGIVGALSGRAFIWLVGAANRWLLDGIAGVRLPEVAQGGEPALHLGAHGLWLVPLVTTLGGLVVGLLVFGLAPEAEGHGTDAAVNAFHRKGGVIRPRVPPVKLLASAITIGSGGAAGREGPIALVVAGFGSLYGSWTHRSETDRRLLLLIGMAAGLSAVFRSPLGAGIFAAEVLYSEMEFEAKGLVYTLLASVVSYAINGLFVGWKPLFRVPASGGSPSLLNGVGFVALGLSAGLIAALLPTVFYRTRDLFHAVPIPRQLKPALGGLLVGLLALVLPQVLGGGYGFIQLAIDGRLATSLLAALLFAKILALALTVSSGGSGGVFAPSLFVGAMLGGLVARLFGLPEASFVVVGMAAVFGGAARVPIATILMVTEMTEGYQLLVPATLAVIVSYVIQVATTRRLKYPSLYEAQVLGRLNSPAHSAEQLTSALRLLDDGLLPPGAGPDRVDLRKLLASGAHLELGKGEHLIASTLPEGSACAGRSLSDCFKGEDTAHLAVIAIFRKGAVFLPEPGLRLQARDQLLLVAPPAAHERLEKLFAAPAPRAAPILSR